MINAIKEKEHYEWLFGDNTRAIEAQESRGQNMLVASELLPTEIRGKEHLEKLGFSFGVPLPEDPIFCKAQIPSGFSRRKTEHPMWSEIIDDAGKVVAEIFYKAAFYDRHAWMMFKGLYSGL